MELPSFLTVDDGGFIHVADHRIGLHHILRHYDEGDSPEMIVEEYPTLSLSLVHKVIAFYLDHMLEINAYVIEHDRIIAEQMTKSKQGPTRSELRVRLESKRRAEILPSSV